MSKSLIEHTDELRLLLGRCDQYDQEGEEVPQDLMDKLSEALTGQAEKVDRCASFVARAEAEVTWLKSEKDAIDLQQKKVQRAIDRMKEIGGMVMNAAKSRRLEGMKGHLFYKREVKKVKIDDTDKIPAKYLKSETTIVVDKKALLRDLKAGEEIPGASIDTSDTVIVK